MPAAEPEVSIRPLVPRDADALAELFERNANASTIERFDPFPLTRETARGLADAQTKDLYYVAEAETGLVGFMMLRGWEEGYEVPSFGILVDGAFRGRGVGKLLTAAALAEARAHGAERVRATVYASNAASHAMLRANGFVEVSREPVERPYGPDQRILVAADLIQ